MGGEPDWSEHVARPPRPIQGQAWKLLIVEDNEGDVNLIRRLLQESPESWDTTTVSSLQQADDVIGSDHFDVITADLGLPDSSGLDTVVGLLRRTPETPLVVLTGEADIALGPTAVALGAHDFLLKGGLSSRLLDDVLRMAIERSHREQQLHDIIRQNCDAMIVVDHQGLIRLANPAAESLFNTGRLTGEMFGYPVQAGTTTDITVLGPEEPRYAEMRTASTMWGGEPAVVASLRDITDRRRADELQRRLWHADRLTAVGQLAAGVAHEINNPAAFVLSNLQLIDEELAPLERMAEARGPAPMDRDKLAELRLMLQDCQEGVTRIARIVKDLRIFSRIENDEIEEVSLNDLVNAAHRMTANETRHRARVELDLAPLPLIAGDRSKLMQVLTNLLVNAAQAIEEGTPRDQRIRIRTRVESKHIVLTVEDTGKGIETRNLEKIFDPFFTTKPRGVGTGLGLPLSADIIRKHGGELTVDSKVGLGTTITLTFPRKSELTDALQDKTQPSPSSSRRYRILIIDDEIALLRVMKRQLKAEHDVVTARGAEAGLELIESSGPFDAIVCDLMMPDVDGVEFCRRLRACHPEMAQRVIICSGGAFLPKARSFLNSVETPVLGKPFELHELLAAIEKVERAS